MSSYPKWCQTCGLSYDFPTLGALEQQAASLQTPAPLKSCECWCNRRDSAPTAVVHVMREESVMPRNETPMQRKRRREAK